MLLLMQRGSIHQVSIYQVQERFILTERSNRFHLLVVVPNMHNPNKVL